MSSFATLGMAIWADTALAQFKPVPAHSTFEGLWQGVDRADGSELQLSIIETDGAYEILLRDSFYSLCIADGFTSGRGLNSGIGTPVARNTLQFDLTLFCFADADPTTPVPVSGNSVDLTLKSRGDVLIIEFEPEIYLYRVSDYR